MTTHQPHDQARDTTAAGTAASQRWDALALSLVAAGNDPRQVRDAIDRARTAIARRHGADAAREIGPDDPVDVTGDDLPDGPPDDLPDDLPGDLADDLAATACQGGAGGVAEPGGRWGAEVVRAACVARERGASWAQIGAALGEDPWQTRRAYYDAVWSQRAAEADQLPGTTRDTDRLLAAGGGPWYLAELRADTPAAVAAEIDDAICGDDGDRFEALRRRWWDPQQQPNETEVGAAAGTHRETAAGTPADQKWAELADSLVTAGNDLHQVRDAIDRARAAIERRHGAERACHLGPDGVVHVTGDDLADGYSDCSDASSATDVAAERAEEESTWQPSGGELTAEDIAEAYASAGIPTFEEYWLGEREDTGSRDVWEESPDAMTYSWSYRLADPFPAQRGDPADPWGTRPTPADPDAWSLPERDGADPWRAPAAEPVTPRAADPMPGAHVAVARAASAADTAARADAATADRARTLTASTVEAAGVDAPELTR